MTWHQRIEQHWQQPGLGLSLLLTPLSWLFAAVAAMRRQGYVRGWRRQRRLPLPVVVVGNLHAGGTGKTPVTAALVGALHQRGVAVGIISRGYGRNNADVQLVQADSQAAEVGDEPLLLWRQTGAPVAVGNDRFQAAQALLAAYPQLQLLVADDGLQHYALARDVEIVVFPAADAGRRLCLLPQGPLREPLSRLCRVDALVFSGAAAASPPVLPGLPETLPRFGSHVHAGTLYCLAAPDRTATAADFAGRRVAALAGIARPQRFFDSLRRLGWVLAECRVLPDHAPLSAADLPVAEVVIVTEKDAVKLPPDTPGVWVLPVRAHIEPDLAAWLCRRLSLASAQG